uniref:Uncharacterized protein n=1 Tax=Physcomitrium patens TaxID=3218 RepID=A0A2K1KW81_PHYPA|nr:hypothetical protein PHYPA_005023 [Physcomitrium patens]
MNGEVENSAAQRARCWLNVASSASISRITNHSPLRKRRSCTRNQRKVFLR